MTRAERHALLLDLYTAAVAAANPRAATAAALSAVAVPSHGRVHLLAVGKAADGMAAAAVDWLRAAGLRPVGGVIVASSGNEPAPDDRLRRVVGDHPVPGVASAGAADALGEAAVVVARDDLALVLLSGGASALVAAPVSAELTMADLARTTEALLASGADIALTNGVRKRFSRWGAGRLALVLAPARVLCLAISDVAGDDLATIGSGPCAPDAWTAAVLRGVLEAAAITPRLPARIIAHLDAVVAGTLPETPKADDAALTRVESRVILSNADARHGVVERARALGLDASDMPGELSGEAVRAGARIVEQLDAFPTAATAGRPRVLVWGGEPTVTIHTPGGRGGRCQELALAAAARLAARAAHMPEVAVLAAGTDGRDGPTDAAGAIVDRATWAAIGDAGIDAAAALTTHDAYPALDAAGALVRTGATGTNVRDIVLVLVDPAATP